MKDVLTAGVAIALGSVLAIAMFFETGIFQAMFNCWIMYLIYRAK